MASEIPLGHLRQKSPNPFLMPPSEANEIQKSCNKLQLRNLAFPSADSPISTEMSPSRPTILIVEDDEAFAYAVSRYLESCGYRSIVASGSMAAFRELDKRSVDVVVADVLLGKNEPHGVSLGRMIRNRDQNMPVLLVTGFPNLLETAAPLPGPAMIKPVDLAQLAAAVETSLRERNGENPRG